MEGKSKEITVFDTYTGNKTPLKTETPGLVRWYSCGPTVYADAHVGHARNYIVADTMRRILERHFRMTVVYAMNITDVDDKIIKGTRRKHLLQKYTDDAKALSDAVYEEAFHLYAAGTGVFTAAELEETKAVLKNKTKAGAMLDQKQAKEATAEKELLYRTLRKSLESEVAIRSQEDILQPYLEQLYSGEQIPNEKFQDYADGWRKEFFSDMESLGVKYPDITPCVSRYIPQIVASIAQIVSNGFGYVSSGSVYFDSGAWTEKNTLKKIGSWQAGDPTEPGADKKASSDFALWKAAKKGEPAWASPWGQGRPGWHIECTGMALDIFGETMDVHTGGIDLVFPHHNNEILQTEACLNTCKWATHFLHTGHVHIRGQKMSKSLKNFVTIKTALEKYSAAALRVFFLRHSWNAPMSWVEEDVQAAEKLLRTFTNFLETASTHSKDPGQYAEPEKELLSLLGETAAAVDGSFRDSFNTPAVLLRLGELVTASNSYLARAAQPNGLVTGKVSDYIGEVLSTLGVPLGDSNTKQDALPFIRCSAVFREKVRQLARAKQPHSQFFGECDSLRSEFLKLGVSLEDAGTQESSIKFKRN
ncbi:MAG: cysteinyl-tRNA synthetase [Amphiamblys sp. WSBS2006]|nr:MAG: cysteinyl-tRNA synthetase [Amphiamblys sp. WSBS2006]